MTAPPIDGAAVPSRILDPVNLTVPRPMVLLRLGYRRPAQVPPRSASMIDEISRRGRDLISPRAVGARCAVRAGESGAIEIVGVLQSNSRTLGESLNGCGAAVLFAATIGDAMEDWVTQLSDAGEMTRSLIADAYASAAAIELGVTLESMLGGWLAGEGLEPGRRCAPGYGDWPLSDQTPLLQRLDAGRIGISLSGEALMTPAKSITGVIGGRG